MIWAVTNGATGDKFRVYRYCNTMAGAVAWTSSRLERDMRQWAECKEPGCWSLQTGPFDKPIAWAERFQRHPATIPWYPVRQLPDYALSEEVRDLAQRIADDTTDRFGYHEQRLPLMLALSSIGWDASKIARRLNSSYSFVRVHVRNAGLYVPRTSAVQKGIMR